MINFWRISGQSRAIGGALAMAACFTLPAPALAEGVSIKVGYSLQVAGLQMAAIDMTGDFNGANYSLTGFGESQSLAKLLAKFKGWTTSSGSIDAGKIRSGSYSLDFRIKKKRQSVAMQLASGKVRQLDVYPPVKPSDTRIPITAAHRRDVLDPISAIIVPLPAGKISDTVLCDRTVNVFDGRQRYDLVLTPKRTMSVPAANGAASATVYVCKVKYRPVAGHKPDAKDTTYWAGVEDMELWLSPIQSAGVAIPYRVTAPSPIGALVLAVSRLDVTKIQDHATLKE